MAAEPVLVGTLVPLETRLDTLSRRNGWPDEPDEDELGDLCALVLEEEWELPSVLQRIGDAYDKRIRLIFRAKDRRSALDQVTRMVKTFFVDLAREGEAPGWIATLWPESDLWPAECETEEGDEQAATEDRSEAKYGRRVEPPPSIDDSTPMTPDEAAGILGVHLSCTFEELRAAYRKRVLQWHPDKLDGMAEELKAHATSHMKRINAAYQTLKAAKSS